ncbi:MAG TPA: haloacid dehalogenase type II [Variovorax sp.]|jgi:2-haloacid dehalogenase
MNPIQAVVFDLYGTLFDVHSVAAQCEAFFAGRGRELSALWRQKQLEYTWLRSLMGQYVSFEDATADALVFACRQMQLRLDDERRQVLCNAYLQLSPFPEVPATLRRLNALAHPLAILSNGSRRSIDEVVGHAGLRDEFAHLISVDEVRVFKPHASVYTLAEQRLGIERSSILFVSSNAWDATGARYFGYRVCWVDRYGGAFDEMGQRPDHVVADLQGVATLVAGA